jgi:hypothetical protein
MIRSASLSKASGNGLREGKEAEQAQESHPNEGGVGHCSAIEYLSNLNSPISKLYAEVYNSLFFLV